MNQVKGLEKTTVVVSLAVLGKLAESDKAGELGDLLEGGITQKVT